MTTNAFGLLPAEQLFVLAIRQAPADPSSIFVSQVGAFSSATGDCSPK
jgi:hypothetical protein